jgi:serine/threonine protein kinase
MDWISDKAMERLREAAETPDLSGTEYRLVEKIARGGMGVVWLAEDAKLERRIALKVLDVDDASGAMTERLLREAKILARLEHPGIVPVHDVGRLADGRVFYTMKYVEGARLDKHLANVSAIPDRLRLFTRICEPVAFAHSRGVLHRDLKPENVMVGPFGEVLVMDWGVAKVIQNAELGRQKSEGRSQKAEIRSQKKERQDPEEGRASRFFGPKETVGPQDDTTPEDSGSQDDTMLDARRTEQGAILGTPGYMAPEQARGEVESLDGRADVFALGTILQFVLTGNAPEDATTAGRSGEGRSAVTGRHAAQTASVPKALRAIVAKAMAHEPCARYAGARELAADVARYLDGLPVEAYPEGLWRKAARLYARHRIAIWLIFSYMLVRGLILIFLKR